MSAEDGENEEPIVCTSCNETPHLFYDPTADEPLRLKCDCDFGSVAVTECLNDTKLLEPFSGRWSNFDYNSTARYDET